MFSPALEPTSRREVATLFQMKLSSKFTDELETLLLDQPSFDRQDAQAWLQLAWQMVEVPRLEIAIACFHQTVRVTPTMVEAWANLGSLYRRLGQLEPAIESFREAIRHQPDNLRLIQSAAATLRQAGLRLEAKSLCEKGLALEPTSTELLLLLGNIFQELDDFPSAIEYLERSIELSGRTAVNISCLGIAYYRQGEIERAVTLFRESLVLDPNYPDGHFHLGMAMLLCGDYKQGWSEYEWRPGGRQRPISNPSIPLWNGRPLTTKQTLLIAAEQGFGDTIQFVWLIAELKSRYGCKITLQSPRPLLPLLSTCNGIDEWVARGEPLPPIDCYLPLASLPSILRWNPEHSKQPFAYLSADTHRVQMWKEVIAAKVSEYPSPTRLRIGLSWQGDPKFPVDHCRSIPLRYFCSLIETPNMRWISLQKGFGSEQLSTVSVSNEIIHFGERLDAEGGAFLDTAAIMQNLDLVITSDTAIAHLAGACGVPVWIGINYVPDWRWNMNRTDSVWYPSARLFRQPQLGDWESVIQQMRTALSTFPSRFISP